MLEGVVNNSGAGLKDPALLSVVFANSPALFEES
jgi:hypothetical protein